MNGFLYRLSNELVVNKLSCRLRRKRFAVKHPPAFSDGLYFGYRTKIKNKIQNDSPKFSLIDAIFDISVASDFTTHQ
jgi:hypothetical protein